MQQMAQRMGIEYTEEQLNAYAEVGGTPHLDMQYLFSEKLWKVLM